MICPSPGKGKFKKSNREAEIIPEEMDYKLQRRLMISEWIGVECSCSLVNE